VCFQPLDCVRDSYLWTVKKRRLFPPPSNALLHVARATVTSATRFLASSMQLKRVFSCLLSDLVLSTLLVNNVFDVLRRLQLRLPLVSDNHDRLFSYPRLAYSRSFVCHSVVFMNVTSVDSRKVYVFLQFLTQKFCWCYRLVNKDATVRRLMVGTHLWRYRVP
jgi:hypothetical protein